MKGLKKDKVSKKTAKKIMVALACMMATTLPFSQNVYAANAYGTEASGSKHETSNQTVSGAAENLELEIDTGDTDDKAYGGSAENADATGNKVTVSGNGTTTDWIEGGRSETTDATKVGNATGNIVTIAEGATGNINSNNNSAGIIGGYAKDGSSSNASGDATKNEVHIEGGGNISGLVVGGRSIFGAADSNEVHVSGGALKGNSNKNGIIGGESMHGSVGSNKVFIKTGADVTGDVMGGSADNVAANDEGNAINNSVKVSGGTVAGQVDGGRAAGKGRADGNTVTVTGGTIDGAAAAGGEKNAIIGGNGAAGAKGNTVDISGGDITGSIYGGFSTTGDVGDADAHNKVAITGGTFQTDTKKVIGGYAAAGNAVHNEVEVTLAADGSFEDVIGGLTAGGSGKAANNNVVTISGDHTLTANVDGGRNQNGDALHNTVTINGKVQGVVVGGNAGGSGNADDNHVYIKADIAGGDVRGGSSENGNANSNTVNVRAGAAIDQNVVGGYSGAGSADNNELTVEGSAASAVGGYVEGTGEANGNKLTLKGNASLTDSGAMKGAAAGVALKGTAEGNNLFIQDNATIAGYAAAGVASVLGGTGAAVNNTLTMTGGTVDGNVQGGYSIGGNATGNHVIMSGGTAGNNVYGGYALNNARDSGNAADNNTVEISGGTVTHHVMGGNGWSGANENTVTLKGGTFGQGVYGGRIEGADTSLLRGNQVFISGAPEFTNTGATITAAFAKNASETDRYVNTSGTGNNVYLGYADQNTTAALTKAMTVDTIAGENVYLGAFGGEAVTAGESGAAITAKNVKANSINLSKVALDRVVGEDFTLLEATDNLDVATVTDGTVTMGTTLQQDVGKQGNKIGFKAGTRKVQDQTTHALLNAQAGVAALAAGNTLIERATTGLEADGFTGENPQEWRAFAYVGGGKAEYDTGSSVTTNTWNGMVGFGRHDKRKDGGALTYGVFYEYGNGNYSTDDSAGQGDGQARYNGGGLLAKNETAKGFYYEGSFRAGRMTNDARNILRAGSRTYGYNEDSNYWGFHLGVGKVLKFNNDRSLDVYGKYFYNHLDGVSFDAAGHYDLDDVKTSLLRLGARYNFWKRAGWTSYGGFAYEYEFGGEAGGFADGFAIRKADLGGSSVLFELGMKLQPDEKSPWGLDLNLTAHAGQRKGVMGGATVSYAF